MDYIELIYKLANGLAGTGFLIGIILLWKTGLLEFLINLKKNGNGKLQEYINADVKETLRDHTEHLMIANQEMGIIKNSLQNIENLIEKHTETDKEMFGKILEAINKK